MSKLSTHNSYRSLKHIFRILLQRLCDQCMLKIPLSSCLCSADWMHIRCGIRLIVWFVFFEFCFFLGPLLYVSWWLSGKNRLAIFNYLPFQHHTHFYQRHCKVLLVNYLLISFNLVFSLSVIVIAFVSVYIVTFSYLIFHFSCGCSKFIPIPMELCAIYVIKLSITY